MAYHQGKDFIFKANQNIKIIRNIKNILIHHVITSFIMMTLMI